MVQIYDNIHGLIRPLLLIKSMSLYTKSIALLLPRICEFSESYPIVPRNYS